MNCPKCNYDNADNAMFCANCGGKLEFINGYSPVDMERPVDVSADIPATNDVSGTPQLPVYGAQTPAAPAAPVNDTYPTYSNAPAPAPVQQSAPFPAYGQQPMQPQQNMQPYNGSGYQYNNTQRPGQQRDWAAITALVCGILSFPCCFTFYGGVVMSIAAIVFGILGLKSSKKSMAIVGIVLGGVALVLTIVVIIFSLQMANTPEFMDQYMDAIEDAMNV